mmetsp:Transcript_28489/g.69340  ORF Transcript_28489/g.69340 Transcript_28489/m.69340 type:complete len:239 (-) Transcript_28489:53-769(-)|eukprot:CAMPEP_0113482946 /NCGR_PEP_ID=MMETSP0014_2-20120614/23181_1 /TAXON_ID=2857 /ORGANISM="Nitzschia sp." /LENGTH=238 /DNA_ID=CAMNT_0000376479 /DNA_START=170 /DNA_END=886 /DNA_ORIENTATION=+ /assembly_acc=CAM_ASM_000159
MAFNRLYKKIETLIRTEDAVPSDIPCKSGILSVRDCRKGGKACDDLGLELLRCMAQYKVDTTEKVRAAIGVAKYNEYTKEMEAKHGAEKAAEIMAEPTQQLKDIEAYQVIHRVANNQHPKGAPKSKSDLKDWSYVDQVRLEMGEKEWYESVRIVGSEFGLESTDKLLNLKATDDLVESAKKRLVPGYQEKKAQAMAAVQKITDEVKSAAPAKDATQADYAAAFKELYPTKDDLIAALK